MNEPVRVFVDFKAQQVRPVAFLRAGRRYDVQRVNLVYKRRLGARYVWCFAVSDSGNNFILMYDPESLQWMLEEISSL
ncbi:MAG: hypothetical protein HY420_04110 [Candidatus Kerfeldbacteria bacterium]|nr:hypothetical protein [Candidatus Kerfeldbacteria bacterium]